MIEVKVTNPDEIKLAITIELPIGQWREIRRRVGRSHRENVGIDFDDPLADILLAISRGIGTIEDRAGIEVPERKPANSTANQP